MPQLNSKLKAERIQQSLADKTLHDKLKAERIQERLAALPGWDAVRDGSALRRRVELPTVRAAGLFANLAAEIGASAGVRPAIHLHGREVTVTVATSAGPGHGSDPDEGDGLTDLDFDVAELLSLPALARDATP